MDATIAEFQKLQFNNKTRYVDIGKAVDVQLKCTNGKRFKTNDGLFTFDLDVKNHNDLIWRRKLAADTQVNPLLLIILVLPKDSKQWLQILLNETLAEGVLKIGGIAYWYFPERIEPLSSNKKTVRLYIPPENKVDLDFIVNVFNTIKN